MAVVKTKNEMLRLFTIYFSAAKKYRKELTLVKIFAVEQYISNAPNQRRAAWKVNIPLLAVRM